MTTKTRIVKIGNSHGIRVPKVLLDQAQLPDEVELRAEPGSADETKAILTETFYRKLGKARARPTAAGQQFRSSVRRKPADGPFTPAGLACDRHAGEHRLHREASAAPLRSHSPLAFLGGSLVSSSSVALSAPASGPVFGRPRFSSRPGSQCYPVLEFEFEGKRNSAERSRRCSLVESSAARQGGSVESVITR